MEPEEGLEKFLQLCLKSGSSKKLSELFDLFFTLEEKETFGKRYLIVKALEEGRLTQREIAKKYGVSISQITRGSNALKVISPSLRKFLQIHWA